MVNRDADAEGLQRFLAVPHLLQNLIGRDFAEIPPQRAGRVWSVLNPLLMNVVMVVVFSTLFDMRGSGIENFPYICSLERCCSTFSMKEQAAPWAAC
ncbi:MAG: hypothetical protein ACLRZH_06575 [Ruthenibacterium lactatiformans]